MINIIFPVSQWKTNISRGAVLHREVVYEGAQRIIGGCGGVVSLLGGGGGGILLSSIFHDFSPLRSAASVCWADGSILFYLSASLEDSAWVCWWGGSYRQGGVKVEPGCFSSASLCLRRWCSLLLRRSFWILWRLKNTKF